MSDITLLSDEDRQLYANTYSGMASELAELLQHHIRYVWQQETPQLKVPCDAVDVALARFNQLFLDTAMPVDEFLDQIRDLIHNLNSLMSQLINMPELSVQSRMDIGERYMMFVDRFGRFYHVVTGFRMDTSAVVTQDDPDYKPGKLEIN